MYILYKKVLNSERNYAMLIKQVQLTYYIPEILSDLKDIYLFAVKLIIQSEEQLSKGYFSCIDKLVKDGKICTEFCDLLDADTLMNVYAKDYFEKKDLPSNILMERSLLMMKESVMLLV